MILINYSDDKTGRGYYQNV